MKTRYRDEFCTVTDCKNTHYARSWCRTHYDRWRTYGDPTGGPTVYFRTHRHEVMDVLESDGGWLTAAGIQLQLPHLSEKQIAESCRSAAARELLQARQVELAGGGRLAGRFGVDVRWEWRIP